MDFHGQQIVLKCNIWQLNIFSFRFIGPERLPDAHMPVSFPIRYRQSCSYFLGWTFPALSTSPALSTLLSSPIPHERQLDLP